MKQNDGNDHSLLIRQVKTTDYGSYLCKAHNKLGITEKIVELSGLANPAVFKKELRSASSTSYNFIWEVDSYSPIIEYQFWFRKYRVRMIPSWANRQSVGRYIPAPACPREISGKNRRELNRRLVSFLPNETWDLVRAFVRCSHYHSDSRCACNGGRRIIEQKALPGGLLLESSVVKYVSCLNWSANPQ